VTSHDKAEWIRTLDSLYLPKTKLFFLTADLRHLLSLLIHATGKEKVWMSGSRKKRPLSYIGGMNFLLFRVTCLVEMLECHPGKTREVSSLRSAKYPNH